METLNNKQKTNQQNKSKKMYPELQDVQLEVVSGGLELSKGNGGKSCGGLC
ncbi:hypothetical protein [Nostoc sp. UHCC 0251]|uniref:hypothetical protein n=1 Tax=Nostoc sp. UHCC 0251 TaxID=3110240 RepID=UPI002B217084|nr:hypothetical protein [Nostoc sp. UHCC 0251]MEA5621628.1 hypothetical protein [Nostoc sp. UHCC 0251]